MTAAWQGATTRAQADLGSSSAHIDLGDSSLTLRGKPGTRIILVPSGSDRFTRLLATRITRVRIDKEGTATITPLPSGRYTLLRGTRDLRTWMEIEVAGETEVSLARN